MTTIIRSTTIQGTLNFEKVIIPHGVMLRCHSSGSIDVSVHGIRRDNEVVYSSVNVNSGYTDIVSYQESPYVCRISVTDSVGDTYFSFFLEGAGVTPGYWTADNPTGVIESYTINNNDKLIIKPIIVPENSEVKLQCSTYGDIALHAVGIKNGAVVAQGTNVGSTSWFTLFRTNAGETGIIAIVCYVIAGMTLNISVGENSYGNWVDDQSGGGA